LTIGGEGEDWKVREGKWRGGKREEEEKRKFFQGLQKLVASRMQIIGPTNV